MRVVADTNILVSAILWVGPPHQILLAAEAGQVSLYTSQKLIEELEGVLSRPKFSSRLLDRRVTVDDAVASYLGLAHLVTAHPIPRLIADDPSDDAVLACALAAQAAYIVTGDFHLLDLERYRTTHIVSPGTFIAILRGSRKLST